MKALLVSTPVLGHLNPLLSVGRILISDRHEVVGLSSTYLRGRIEAIGATFRGFLPGADFDIRNASEQFPSRAKAAAHDPGTWFRRLHAAAISKHQTSHAGVSVRHCHRRSSDAGRTADAARSPVETAPGGFAGNDLSFIAPR